MPASLNATHHHIARLRTSLDRLRAAERLNPAQAAPPAPRLRLARTASRDGVRQAWDDLQARTGASDADRACLADPLTLDTLGAYASSIEGMVGTIKVPVGLAGPLRVNGLHAGGDYLVPLATTEAALVASYSRGAHAISLAGGASAALVNEGMMRSPGFAFASVLEAGMFAIHCVDSFPALKAAAEATTRHGKLVELAPQLEGDTVFLLCRYTTGDASGQNMTTIATEALCRAAVAGAPVQPRHWFIEANLSGDKKGSALAMMGGRGRSVVATVLLPAELVARVLRTTPAGMDEYGRMASIGGVLSGTLGRQAHVANGLAALYLATGQDVACVAESAVGVTRMELRGPDLFASVTLPSLVLGTVGGGTGLPSQSAALRLMGLAGPGKAAALAEVAAALCLAGEISIIAALSAGQFTQAHHALARTRA